MNEDVLIIKKAEPRQFQEVRAFYHSLIDGLEGCPYGAGWIKDIYPAPDFLRESIDHGDPCAWRAFFVYRKRLCKTDGKVRDRSCPKDRSEGDPA